MDFWQVHGTGMGVLFLLGMLFFPRITFLVAVLSPFGWLHWLGWLFAPRFTAALMATFMYWPSNKVLVALAWVAAFSVAGGQSGGAVKSRNR